MDRSYFETAITYVFQNEGGYVNDPNDYGGPTNYGITLHDLSFHRGSPATPSDVKIMSPTEAKEIYFGNYWEPLLLDQVTSLAIATAIFDTAVLYGKHTGVSFAQHACNSHGDNLAVDGWMGADTLKAVNAIDVRFFLRTYVANIYARIADIIQARPRNEAFKKGWESRANRLLALA